MNKWIWIVIGLVVLGAISNGLDESKPSDATEETDSATTENDQKESSTAVYEGENNAEIKEFITFLSNADWKCTYYDEGDGSHMVGSVFSFSENEIRVTNATDDSGYPFHVDYIMPDFPKPGISTAQIKLNEQTDMISTFDDNKNMIMLSWDANSVKLMLERQ